MREIVRFLFEVGHLKRVARSGWWLAGVRDPESVAEHSFRCAWIGYLLARRHGAADPAQVVLTCLLNDLHEARVNDLHKTGQAYVDYASAESRAFRDQVAPLPDGEELQRLHADFQSGATLESRLARDADRLECAFQAREYMDEGHPGCRDWFDNTRAALSTDVARELFAALAEVDPREWVRRLPRVP